VEDKYKNKIITVPNLLSFFRLLLIPVIVWLYVAKYDAKWACYLLILSGITDVVDGIIARNCHMVSDFGKAFDPVADKLTQIAVLFCLVTEFKWMLLPLCVLVVKEITAGILGLLVIRKTGKVDGAVWHGKATTVSLYSMMIIHLLWFHIPGAISGTLIGGCTTLAMLSAFLYTKENVKKLLRERDCHARK
jgi:cardiolipin synthase